MIHPANNADNNNNSNIMNNNIMNNNNNNNIMNNNNNDADAINYNKTASTSGNGSFGDQFSNCESLYMDTPPMPMQMQSSFSSNVRSLFDNLPSISNLNNNNNNSSSLDMDAFANLRNSTQINFKESLDIFNSANQKSLQIGTQHVSPNEHIVPEYHESKSLFFF